MKIICTVNEFAELVRGCVTHRTNYRSCEKCPLCNLCGDQYIEQFVDAENVVPEYDDDSPVREGDDDD